MSEYRTIDQMTPEWLAAHGIEHAPQTVRDLFDRGFIGHSGPVGTEVFEGTDLAESIMILDDAEILTARLEAHATRRTPRTR